MNAQHSITLSIDAVLAAVAEVELVDTDLAAARFAEPDNAFESDLNDD